HGMFLLSDKIGRCNVVELTSLEHLLHCDGVNNQTYICESGHCCGESQCCSYYYELWWFWLVWAIIFILCCCCVCHHRRTKHRLQQQQRQHEINLIAYREAHNYPSVPFYFSKCYDECVSPEVVAFSPCGCASQDTGRNLLSDGVSREGFTSQEKRSGSGDDTCKDPLLKDLSEGCAEDKDRLPIGRKRRFTGDSGIEVCVCGTRGSNSFSGAGGTGQEGKELRELESLLGREGDDGGEAEGEEEAGDFCDSCGHRASFGVEEEQVLCGPERRGARGPSVPPQPVHQIGSAALHPPVCLLLHTINEQEGPHHSTSTEPQG
uniref:WW domain binding protein 1-like b n=1 Tax=Labrus bergylta TaxID=56723 RepID=A0A3Q3EYW2_9LABR